MAKDSMSSPASAQEEDLNTRHFMGQVNSRMTKIAGVALCVALGVMLTSWVMPPKRESVPYVVTVNDKTGEVNVPSNRDVEKFEPTWVNASYFLRRWIKDLFTINQYLTVNITDPRAQRFIRGSNAITEYNTFRADDDTFGRLAADPSLVRDVKVVSLTPVAGTENGAVAQVMLTTHEHGRAVVETKLVTLYYLYVHSNDSATRKANPIGIYVTDFKVSGAD